MFSGSIGIIAACIIAYFIGNVSPSTMLARSRGLDIKKEGSGNAGTTNALRVLGKKAAVLTLVVDILKGCAAVGIGWLLAGQAGAYGCALCVMLGHIWPVIYRFRGGKGVATSFGALLVIDPPLALAALAIVALATVLSRRMSVGSMVGLVLLPVLCIFMEPDFVPISIVIAIIMLLKHRGNMVRLLHGEEPILGIFDRGKEQATEEEWKQEEDHE